MNELSLMGLVAILYLGLEDDHREVRSLKIPVSIADYIEQQLGDNKYKVFIRYKSFVPDEDLRG